MIEYFVSIFMSLPILLATRIQYQIFHFDGSDYLNILSDCNDVRVTHFSIRNVKLYNITFIIRFRDIRSLLSTKRVHVFD